MSFNFIKKYEVKAYQFKAPLPMAERIENVAHMEDTSYNGALLALVEFGLDAYEKNHE